MTGINVDPTNEPGAPPVSRLRTWVRLVSSKRSASYAAECQAAGIAVLAVVTEESGGVLVPADVYQIGNEPDSDSPGSGPNNMSPASYVEYWNLYRFTYPDFVMIGAGLSSGDPLYWHAIQNAGGLSGASGMAIHPYGKNADDAARLIDAYRRWLAMPIWITEWNRPPNEIVEFRAMLRAETVADAWFAYSDNVIGYGLDGTRERLLSI